MGSRKPLEDDKTLSDHNIQSESDTISIDDEHVVNSRKPRREKEPISQDKNNQVTKRRKIPQIQYTDKVVDVSVMMQRQNLLDAKLLKDLRGLGKPLSFD